MMEAPFPTTMCTAICVSKVYITSTVNGSNVQSKKLSRRIIAIKSGIKNEDNRTLDFVMRPDQEEAVNKTIFYFESFKKENKDKTPHFLWNAKMRFGKTFAS